LDDDEAGTARLGEVSDNSLGRLLTLADGVFAIAMTLLALDLHVPDLGGDTATNAELLHALGEEVPSFATYLLSFYVVASYWTTHHRLMRSVQVTHPRLQIHTLMLLTLVAALPFPSGLLARYASTPVALSVYGVVNVLASLMLLWLRHDIRAYGLSAGPADEDARFRTGWVGWGRVAVFALCIPAGFVLGGKGPWVLALLVVVVATAAPWSRWRNREVVPARA
jgi:uncharacterized membrane protein